MKKYISTLLVFGLVSGVASADEWTMTINGKIIPATCTVSNSSDRTITMDSILIDAINGTDNEVKPGQNGAIHFDCPNTTGIQMKVEDATRSGNFEFLQNVAGRAEHNPDNLPFARNAHVKLYYENETTALLIGPGRTAKRIRNKTVGSGANEFTTVRTSFRLTPSYFRNTNANTVTPGRVVAQAKLTFTYD